MTEIVALLQIIAPLLEKTTLRQLSQVVFGMLVASGRITMLGLSRWAEKGGSYRTIQRLYHTVLPWNAIQWLFFRKRFLQPVDEYLIAGDEVVVSKAGKETYGLDRFFAGLQQQVIPGLAFFAFALVNVREEQSYPLQISQIVKSETEKAACKTKKAAKQAKKTAEKRKPGRPKGSKNKAKAEVVLSAELLRVQSGLRRGALKGCYTARGKKERLVARASQSPLSQAALALAVWTLPSKVQRAPAIFRQAPTICLHALSIVPLPIR